MCCLCGAPVGHQGCCAGRAWLLRHDAKGGIYYFAVQTKGGIRRIAVSALEASLSRLADAVLVDDATQEDRARVLAQERARHP